MPLLCIGPVCIPLNLLLPFLLGIAHRYGWLKWFKQEWVTLTWWRQLFNRWRQQPATGSTAAGATTLHGGSTTTGNIECAGGTCRIAPSDEAAAATGSAAAATASKQQDVESSTAAAAGGGAARRKKA